MDGYSAPGGLLTHDVVAMQQITTVLSNEFDILDASGGVIGRVVGTDSLGARLFTGPREFTLHEADGTPLLGIHDVPDFGLDTFALTRPDGGTVATLTKRLALFQTVVDVTPPTAPSSRCRATSGTSSSRSCSGRSRSPR